MSPLCPNPASPSTNQRVVPASYCSRMGSSWWCSRAASTASFTVCTARSSRIARVCQTNLAEVEDAVEDLGGGGDDPGAAAGPGHGHHPALLVRHHARARARQGPPAGRHHVGLTRRYPPTVDTARIGEVVHLVVKNYPS